jgi:hypothetical protein
MHLGTGDLPEFTFSVLVGMKPSGTVVTNETLPVSSTVGGVGL